MTDFWAFALAVLTLLITPGPTNTVMATAGASGARSPWPLVAAEIAGYGAIIGLARLVLLPLIEQWPPLGVVLKAAVVVYLLYAAWKLWRSRLAIAGAQEGSIAPIGPRLLFVTTFLNPKGLIFATAVFPREHPQLPLFFAGFCALVALCGTAWFFGGRGLAQLAGRRATLLPRAGAVALLVFAGLLAASLGR